MPAEPARRAVRRPAAQSAASKKAAKPKPEKPPLDIKAVVSSFQQFLANKAMINVLATRNDGTKDKPGLKPNLLAVAMMYGEKDPETGSYFFDLPKPLVVEGQKFTGFKAERRGGAKTLNEAKARALLEEKDRLADVERYHYSLVLSEEEGEAFHAWLKKSGLVTRVSSTACVLDEDELLQLRYTADPDDPRETVLTDDDIDGLYDEGDPTYAFVPQKK